MRPLTHITPKPLVKLNGKPILEYILSNLPQGVNEAVLVIGYLGEQIENYFGGHFGAVRLTYVKQLEQLGTFHALLQAKPVLAGEFLVLMGDDLYSKADLTRLVQRPLSILVHRASGPSEKFGVCLIDKKGFLQDIREKEKGLEFSFAGCGAYKLNHGIFNEEIFYGPTGEQYLSSMVGSLARKEPIQAVKATYWFPIANPSDLVEAAKLAVANF